MQLGNYRLHRQSLPLRSIMAATPTQLRDCTKAQLSNPKPVIAVGWQRSAPGKDGRSPSVLLTPEGLAKRTETRRYWKISQRRHNTALDHERMVALHALMQGAMELSRISLQPTHPST